MSSLIVPVATIEAIKPHTNADSLERVQCGNGTIRAWVASS
jgi:hypothetical protein